MATSFHIVDVFSRRPFAGNPVAVVFAPDEDEATMRAIASIPIGHPRSESLSSRPDVNGS